MLSKVFLLCFVAYAAAQYAVEDPPQPYSFNVDSTDEYGNRLYRTESGDANNFKTGSYGYHDAAGVYRHVEYVADADGFRATVQTNEPGTKSSAPAGVQYSSQAVESAQPAAAVARPATAGYTLVPVHHGGPITFSLGRAKSR
ncbi:cuticle protein 10.9-like [Ornithodoros turicata]|uniref:cuticle protein 10.9-like n=1 Tax=Ornithodoros turicata TaxID=34597 RepID=UPI003138AD87